MQHSLDALLASRAPRCYRHRSTSWCGLADTARIRDWAAAVLDDIDPNDRVDALLVVSELVDNARAHGLPPGGARMWRVGSGHRLRIEVKDSSSVRPRLRVPAHTEPNGRGLLMVDALTTAWGVWRHSWGKTVWAEVPLPVLTTA